MKTYKEFLSEQKAQIPKRFEKYRDRIRDWTDERKSGNPIFVDLKDDWLNPEGEGQTISGKTLADIEKQLRYSYKKGTEPPKRRTRKPKQQSTKDKIEAMLKKYPERMANGNRRNIDNLATQPIAQLQDWISKGWSVMDGELAPGEYVIMKTRKGKVNYYKIED